jgi:tetratricopeptide (TPR) repeat protein
MGRSGSVALVVAGCAHEKAFKRGTKLSEQGRYEQAIASLEEAVALAEKDGKEKAAERYREKLAEVKVQACRSFYRDAELAFGRADLGEAQTLIERCMTYCPNEQPYSAFRQRVRQAIADAERVRSEALALAEEKQWSEAVQRMEEALRLYATMPGGRGDLKQIEERAYRHYVGRADERLRANDLEGAESEAQLARVYKDAGTEANAVLQTVQNRREATGLIARGRTLLAQGKSEEALPVLERAQRLHPAHAELPTLLSQARRGVCDSWIARGRQAMETGDYPAALRLYRKSRDLLAGYGGVDTLIEETRARLAQVHMAAFRQNLDRGAAGSAVAHGAAALGYEPGNFEARRQLGQAAGRVRDEVRYTIGFVGFRSRPEQQATANRLASTALEHLTRTRPANVTLVDRTDLQAVLQELDLSAGDLVDPMSRVPAGKLKGVNALIIGQVLEGTVTTQTAQVGQGESTYQDGHRAEPNLDHVQAAAELNAALTELERARVRLGEAEARLARYEHADPDDAQAQARKRKAQADVAEARQRLVNAATTVGTAELRLAAIPPEVLVPNVVKHTFPIEEVTWTARVRCMIKMADAATAELLVAEQVEGQHAQSDRMVAGDASRNVPEDPLELPEDRVLLEHAAEALTGKLKDSLTAASQMHGRRFVTAVQRAEAAGDVVGAADAAVKYLFAYPKGGPQTNTMVNTVRQYLGAEDDLIDIRALLRTHCHVLLK